MISNKRYFKNFMNCEKHPAGHFVVYRYGPYYLADFSNRISKNLMNDYEIKNNITNFLERYCKNV